MDVRVPSIALFLVAAALLAGCAAQDESQQSTIPGVDNMNDPGDDDVTTPQDTPLSYPGAECVDTRELQGADSADGHNSVEEDTADTDRDGDDQPAC